MRTYVIGDIHGRSDLLDALLSRIRSDAGGCEHRILAVGDYIDVGQDSKGVLDILMSRPDIEPLRGNHEQMLLDAIESDYGPLNDFFSSGGHATLKSFEVDLPVQIPSMYLRFMARMPLWLKDDLRFFVHAGIDPTLPIQEQRTRTLLWSRDEFLAIQCPFEKYVVHGHTPVPHPDVRPNRCNIDTFAVKTGTLTCAVFDDTQAHPVDFIQT